MASFASAIAQLPITGDARENGKKVQAAMLDAAAAGARGTRASAGLAGSPHFEMVDAESILNPEHLMR